MLFRSPVHVEGATGAGKKLQSWDGGAVGAVLSADDEDGTVSHDHGAGVPAAVLESELLEALLPVVRGCHAGGSVRNVESDTVSGVARPSTNVDLATGLVGEDETSRAEDIGLDVHGAESVSRRIPLVSASRARGSGGSGLLNEGDLSVLALGGDQGDDGGLAEENVLSSGGTLGEAVVLDGGTNPLVVGESVTSTAEVSGVTGAGGIAVGLSDQLGSLLGGVALITTVALLTVLHTGSIVTVVRACLQALVTSVGSGVDDLLRQGLDVLVHKASLVLPESGESSSLGRGRGDDLDVTFGVDAVPVAAAADLGERRCNLNSKR